MDHRRDLVAIAPDIDLDIAPASRRVSITPGDHSSPGVFSIFDGRAAPAAPAGREGGRAGGGKKRDASASVRA